MNDAQKRARARRQLALIALVVALPLIAAYAFYYGGWRPPMKVRGELLDPARPIADAALRGLDGSPRRFGDLRGKWTLVYFGPADCPPACRDNLRKMQQVQAAQGREAERVQRVFVLTDATTPERMRDVLSEYPQTQVLSGDRAAVRALAGQFRTSAGTPLDDLHRVYLVDPLGNLVLSYGADADPTGIRKDLARLLRVSRVG